MGNAPKVIDIMPRVVLGLGCAVTKLSAMSRVKNARATNRASWRAATLTSELILIVSLLLVNPASAHGATAPISPVPNVPCCGGGGPVWGFDTDSTYNSTFMSQAATYAGNPTVVGGYLVNKWRSLNGTQVSYLHNKGIAIVLLDSPDVSSLLGSTQAATNANAAISAASTLGAHANSNIAIYIDVEPHEQIDPGYINGWYTTVTNAGYIPGFYENSLSGSNDYFEPAFCSANTLAAAKTGSYLYSQQLQFGSSYEQTQAPTTYNPQYQGCETFGQVSGWQYLINDPSVNLDVDEFAQVGLF